MPSTDPRRDQDSPAATFLSGRSWEVRVIVVGWFVAGLMCGGMWVGAHWHREAANAPALAVVRALDLNGLVTTPSGTAARLPGGDRRAVVPVHVPGAAAALVAVDEGTP